MTGAELLPTDPSTTHQTPDLGTESSVDIPVDGTVDDLTVLNGTEPIEASLYYDASTMAPLSALSLVGPPPPPFLFPPP